MKNRASKSSRERGIALISVLWGVMALSLIALTVLSLSRINGSLTGHIVDQAKAEAAADAGLYEIIRQMSAMGGARDIPPKVATRTVNFNGYSVEVRIVPEKGKIDLNTADGLLISAVFGYAGINEGEANDIAAQILQYRASSTGKAFRVVSDLGARLELSENIYRCVLPFFTVYANVIGVDYSVASDEVKDMIRWADRQHWGGRNWMEINGTSAGALVSGAQASVLQSSSSHSGKAYSLIAKVSTGGFILRKRAVIRLTGNRSDPFWVYMWVRDYHSDKTCEYQG